MSHDSGQSPAAQTDLDCIRTLAAGPQLGPCFAIAADLPEGSIGLVCQGLACNEPAQSDGQLEQQLGDRRGLTL